VSDSRFHHYSGQVMIARSLRNCATLAVFPVLLSAQVAFSRRVYDQRARTYQQIWIWNPADGSFKPLTDSGRHHFQPSCSSDGRHIYFLSGTDLDEYNGLWDFDRKTGREREVSADPKIPAGQANRPPTAGCSHAVWAPGNTRFACSSGQDVLIYAAATKKEVGRAHFTERPTVPDAMAWSPNQKWLLVETQGQDTNSTSPQSDYFLLDLGRMAWVPAGSGSDAIWLPDRNEIVYSTPRDSVSLTPSSKRNVWSSQLVVFDPATHRRTQLTSGVTNNVQPAPCTR
jgi:Tol biopolymer transport system component